MSLASWANQRLSTILGTEVSDVVDYLVGIEDDGELEDFVSGMLPGGSESGAFIAELKRKKEQERKGATAADVGQERQHELSGVVGKQRDKLAGRAAGRDLDQTRSLLSMPSKNEVASAALERLNQNASRSAEIRSPLGGLAKELPGLGGYPEGGLKAYLKGSEDDVLGGDAAPGKKKGKSKVSVVAGSDQDNGQGKALTPEFQTEASVFKPKLSRAERAKMITSSLAAGGGAFLAPGRKVTSWVGNGDDYK